MKVFNFNFFKVNTSMYFMDNNSYSESIICILQKFEFDHAQYFNVFHKLLVKKEGRFIVRDETSIVHPFIVVLMGHGPRPFFVYEAKEVLNNMSSVTIKMMYDELQKLLL